MAKLRAIVLSHTEMKNEYFCTTVAINHIHSWRIWRPMSGPGQHLQYHQLPGDPMKYWIPFQRVRFNAIRVPNNRPTHPEDLIIDQSSVEPVEGIIKPRVLMRVINKFTFKSINAMFPSGVVGRYVEEQSLARSNGFIRVERLSVVGERISFTDGAGAQYHRIPIKDKYLLDRIRSGSVVSGEYSNILVRIGLAAPFAGSYGWNPRRCYMMANWIDI